MNASRLLTLVIGFLIAAAGGFFLGRKTVEPPAVVKPTPEQAEDRSQPPPLPRPATVPAVLSEEVMALVGTDKITAANGQAVAYRVLAEGDPLRRLTACMVLLESMNRENARGIMEAFREITQKTGRKHDGEWQLMLRRFGAVRGTGGVKELLNDPRSAGMALEGYAAVDPDGAEKALKELGSANPDLKNYWLTGLCVKDPQRALRLGFSDDFPGANGKALIQQAINSVGVSEAKEMMQKALSAEEVDISERSVFDNAFSQFNENLFHWYTTRGTPGEMMPWMMEQRDAPYVKGHMVDQTVHDNFTQGDPLKTVEFLESFNAGERKAILGTARIYEALLKKPAAVTALSDEDYGRLEKYLLPTAGGEFEALVAAVERINPERAALMRKLRTK